MLQLEDIAKVVVNVSHLSTVRASFNLGLIVGSANIIPPGERVRVYLDTTAMIGDGFSSTDPEFRAAQLYFSQSPKPSKVAIGRWDKTGAENVVEAVAACREANNDWYTCIVTQATKADILAVSAYIESALPYSTYFYNTADSDVLLVSSGNVMQTLKGINTHRSLGQYSTNSASTTGYLTGGAGASTDITLDTATTFKIAVDGDTMPKIVTISVTGNNTGDKIANACQTAIQSLGGAYAKVTFTFSIDHYVITSGLLGSNSKVRITPGDTNDLSVDLKINTLNATTIDGITTFADVVSAIDGYAMGSNTGLANSVRSLAYKTEIGVTTEPITSAQVSMIKSQNGNVYVNKGATYNLFMQGTMADGTGFDEVLNLDMLSNNIQTAVLDVLIADNHVPQTEEGVTMLIEAITGACEDAVTKGFIAQGIWNAPTILNLKKGSMLSKGYLIQADKISSQSQTDRESRISPPIYVAIKLAGFIEHVVVNVNVNR